MLVNSVLCALVLSVPTAAIGISGSNSNSGKVGTIVDNSPEVAALVEDFSAAMRNRTSGRGRDVVAAETVLEILEGRFETCGPRDRGLIVKMVHRSFEHFHYVEETERSFLMEAAKSLAHMGPESVEPLVQLTVQGEVESHPELQRRLILSLGRTRSAEGLPRLLKLLHHSSAMIEASAAEALGEFDFLEDGRRKEVFYALLGRLLDAKDLVDQDEFDLTHRQNFDTIIGAMTTSLQRLSGHDERDPEQWQRFWNKHKNESWGVTTP